MTEAHSTHAAPQDQPARPSSLPSPTPTSPCSHTPLAFGPRRSGGNSTTSAPGLIPIALSRSTRSRRTPCTLDASPEEARRGSRSRSWETVS
jgi:hypothetical protein